MGARGTAGVPEFYEPWERLIRIVVLGKVLEVPENNLLLRQLQYVSEDVGMGRYCWNGECRYCEVRYRRPDDAAEHSVLACRVRGFDGMRLTKLAPEVRYNMSDTLAAAPEESVANPGVRPSSPPGE
jgi:2Fe-2S iron-sulfur cluster binding domain